MFPRCLALAACLIGVVGGGCSVDPAASALDEAVDPGKADVARADLIYCDTSADCGDAQQACFGAYGGRAGVCEVIRACADASDCHAPAEACIEGMCQWDRSRSWGVWLERGMITPAEARGETVDPYVSIWVSDRRQNREPEFMPPRHESSVKENTTQPVWSEALDVPVYGYPNPTHYNPVLNIEVFDAEFLGQDALLASCAHAPTRDDFWLGGFTLCCDNPILGSEACVEFRLAPTN